MYENCDCEKQATVPVLTRETRSRSCRRGITDQLKLKWKGGNPHSAGLRENIRDIPTTYGAVQNATRKYIRTFS